MNGSPQAAGKARTEDAKRRSLGAGQGESERAAAGIGPGQAAGGGDPGSWRFEHESDNLGHESVIDSAGGRELAGRALWRRKRWSRELEGAIRRRLPAGYGSGEQTAAGFRQSTDRGRKAPQR